MTCTVMRFIFLRLATDVQKFATTSTQSTDSFVDFTFYMEERQSSMNTPTGISNGGSPLDISNTYHHS